MIEFAKQQEGDTFVYLSHSQDAKKNPLPYDRKIYWAQLAAGDVVKDSNAKIIIQALQEIEALGYNKLIYICGSDRKEEMETLLNKYNGVPDKKGNIPYTFRSIEIRQFGDERLNEDVPLEKCSASLARKCVEENDLETFKQVVPFGDEDAEELFNELKQYMGLNEELISEAVEIVGEISIKGNTFEVKQTSNGLKMLVGEYRHPDKFRALFDGTPFEFNGATYDEYTVASDKYDNHGKLKFVIDGKQKTIEAVKGVVSKGLEFEAESRSNHEVIEAVIKTISRANNTDVELVNILPGPPPGKRFGDWSNLCKIENMFKPDDQHEGSVIADNIYIVNIKGKEKEIYISNKYGPTHTPINAGINNKKYETGIDVVSPVLEIDKLTDDELKAINFWWNTKSTLNNVSLENDFDKIDEWYYNFGPDKVIAENVKNFIINQYSSGYYYVVKNNGLYVNKIEDYTNYLKSQSIKIVNATLTHSMFAINAAIGNSYYEIDIRRKGRTNYSVMSKLTSTRTAGNISRKGTQINSFKGYDFKYIKKKQKVS